MQSQKWQNDLGRFQDKPFNITVFQVYATTTDAEEAGSDQNQHKEKEIQEGKVTVWVGFTNSWEDVPNWTQSSRD